MMSVIGRISKVLAAVVLAVAATGCDKIDHAADKVEQKLDEVDPMQYLDEGPPEARGKPAGDEAGPVAARSTPSRDAGGLAETKR